MHHRGNKEVDICKKHGATVQSALQTASAIALCNLLKNPLFSSDVESLPTLLKVDVGCIVNMKNILPEIPKADLGCYISTLLTSIQVEHTHDFSMLAAECNMQLNQNKTMLACTFAKNVLLFRKFRIEMAPILCANPYFGRYPGLHILWTNLGNCSCLNLDHLALARINGRVTCTSEHHLGPLFLHQAATILDRLNWNIVYFPNIHSAEVVEFYATESKRIIEDHYQGNLLCVN